MEVSSQLRAPAALSQRKETPLPSEENDVQEAVEKKKIHRSHRELNPGHPARNLVTILS